MNFKRGRPKSKRAGCLMCKPQKAECNSKIERLRPNQRRYVIDSVEALAEEESSAQLRRDIDSMECSDPLCDCHNFYEGGYTGNETPIDWMETRRKLLELNIRVYSESLPLS